MRITPLEVHNHQFGTSFRGFDRDEVRAFLAMISEEYEQVISDNIRLKDQISEMRDQLAESKKRESSIQKAIEAADRITKEMKESARRESDLLIKEARLKANKILDDAQSRITHVEDRVTEVRNARHHVEHSLRSLLEEHLHLLDRSGEKVEDEKIFVLKRPTSA